MINAANMIMQPVNSRPDIVSCRNSAPHNAANTDSRLMIIVAGAGEVYFCPTIWSVKAMLTSRNAVYAIGPAQSMIACISIVSVRTANGIENIPERKN